jgi:hypothetical protein
MSKEAETCSNYIINVFVIQKLCALLVALSVETTIHVKKYITKLHVTLLDMYKACIDVGIYSTYISLHPIKLCVVMTFDALR